MQEGVDHSVLKKLLKTNDIHILKALARREPMNVGLEGRLMELRLKEVFYVLEKNKTISDYTASFLSDVHNYDLALATRPHLIDIKIAKQVVASISAGLVISLFYLFLTENWKEKTEAFLYLWVIMTAVFIPVTFSMNLWFNPNKPKGWNDWKG